MTKIARHRDFLFESGKEMREKNAGRKPREPLKTLQELADDLNIDCEKLRRLYTTHNGPRAKLQVSYNKKRYYSPTEFIQWWNSVANAKMPEIVSANVEPAKKPRGAKKSGYAVGVNVSNYHWITASAQATGRSRQDLVNEIVQNHIKQTLTGQK